MHGYSEEISPKGHWSRRQFLQRAAVGGAGLAGATAFGLACSGRGSPSNVASRSTPLAGAGQPQRGGAYSFYVLANPTLDPMQDADINTQRIAGGVLSRLFRFKTGADPSVGNNRDLENDLGLSAESPDALTWTFKLRPGPRFHDIPPVSAHPVEAEDIKATFQRALALPKNSFRGALDMIDRNQIQTPAADTVVFKLTYPYAPFAEKMASPDSSWIFPREALAGTYDPTKQMIGSGPFVFASGTPDVAFVFKRNPDWFEAGRPYIDTLNRPIILDAAQQLAQFSAGHLDEVNLGTNDLDAMQRSNPKATLIKGQPTGAQMGLVYFPLGDPGSVFQDIRVRRALSLALDRDAIGKTAFGNQYVISLMGPPSLGKWSLQLSQLDAATQQDYRYNPNEAKKLLQEAGVLGQTFKFAYVTGGGFGTLPSYKEAAPTISNMFSAAGLKAEPVAIDFLKDYLGAGRGYRAGNYPKDTLVFTVNTYYTDPDQGVFGPFDSKSTVHVSQLKDARLDAMIAKARTLVDESERLKAYLEIQKYIAEQVYVLPIGGGYQFRMIQPRVQNYQLGSLTGEGVETYAKVWLKQ